MMNKVRIFGIDIGKEGDKPNYIMSGASFWTAKDGSTNRQKSSRSC